MTDWIQDSLPGHERNVVFARGIPVDALTRGLRDQQREPLAHGEGNGWVWAVHEMLNWLDEDYEEFDEEEFYEVDYGLLCPGDAEVVVFVTEPCSSRGHPPGFTYYRDGRAIVGFSFGNLQQRPGDNPDHLSPELLAANLIGPDSACAQAQDDGHDCFDHHYDDHRRLVRVIADRFGLPAPPLDPLLLAAAP
ncbi:hypothetical protein [Streptomyces sp. NBC_01304]|uniref:hypothetical protein n=1 Tax=Streptomyces sp. NBC_01304 TaxID=2903818 RepID=UPI002E124F74|nr:hypothetical protein OG430_07635 [Streptomyces sp. NBC_01304]